MRVDVSVGANPLPMPLLFGEPHLIGPETPRNEAKTATFDPHRGGGGLFLAYPDGHTRTLFPTRTQHFWYYQCSFCRTNSANPPP